MDFNLTHITKLILASLLLPTLLLLVGCDEDITRPLCTVGIRCDDGDNTTINDAFDANCICVGQATACTGIGDVDGDGICTDLDCDDTDSLNTDIDADGDGRCLSVDCDDSDADIFRGAECNDGNPGTAGDTINDDCICVGEIFYGSFVDPRDGQTYATIQIGLQTWMAENLNYETGTSWCYDGDPSNCSEYGRLYNWETALTAAPEGWHLPTENEWRQLVNYLGGEDEAGGAMKAINGWNSPNEGASNTSGFSGTPGGCRSFTGSFNMIGNTAFYWSSEEVNSANVFTWTLYHTSPSISILGNHKVDGMSIRCIKD